MWGNLSVEICEFEIEEATGEAAKAKVRAQACGAGQQGVGIHPWSLKVGHPSLEKKETKKS